MSECASPSFWPGNLPGGIPGVTDHQENGPIGAGTPHARMLWFWKRMEKHEDLIEELTDYDRFSSGRPTFEATIADAFDRLVEERGP
jgi:hypothetical protein